MGPATSSGSTPSFNGAATLSLRKLCSWSTSMMPYPALQWGRNFIVAEIRHAHGICTPAGNASMGPQLYRCRNMPTTISHHDVRPLRFNGAATLSLRKLPPFFIICMELDTLQWGRNFIVAEIYQWLSTYRWQWHSFNGAATLSLRKLHFLFINKINHLIASMGPQLYRCGNLSAGAVLLYSLGRASMGPQLYRCGNRNRRSVWMRMKSASMGPQLYRCGNWQARRPGLRQ